MCACVCVCVGGKVHELCVCVCVRVLEGGEEKDKDKKIRKERDGKKGKHPKPHTEAHVLESMHRLGYLSISNKLFTEINSLSAVFTLFLASKFYFLSWKCVWMSQ